MAIVHRLRSLPALLALACIALAGVIALEAYAPMDPPAPSIAAPVTPAPVTPERNVGTKDAPGETYQSKPLESYVEIAERPVFAQTRRPPPPDSKSGSGGTRSDHDNFMLAGVIMAANKRLAMIETKKTSSVVVVREGQTLEGWSIDSISAEKVVISQGNEVFELLLDDKLKVPRKPVRRTPRSAPVGGAATGAASSATPPATPPGGQPAGAAEAAPDALPPREDAGGAPEEVTE